MVGNNGEKINFSQISKPQPAELGWEFKEELCWGLRASSLPQFKGAGKAPLSTPSSPLRLAVLPVQPRFGPKSSFPPLSLTRGL